MKQHDSTGRVSAFFGANTQVPILNGLLATMWMKGGSIAWRPSLTTPPSQNTAFVKGRKLPVDEATRFDGTCVSLLRCERCDAIFFFSLPPSLPSHAPFRRKNMPAQDPREGSLKVRQKFGPPPWFSSARSAVVCLRKMRRTFFFFFFFPNSRGEERAKKPPETRTMSTKKQKKKIQGSPKMRSPPLVFVRKVRGGIAANDATQFFFFLFPPRFRLMHRSGEKICPLRTQKKVR